MNEKTIDVASTENQKTKTQKDRSDMKNKGPTVVACGYRRVRVKSGLTFPTFLISLPDQSTGVWRSKRDFLVLSRTDPKLFLPKAALSKLAENVPWKNPNCNIPRCCSGPENLYHISMSKNILKINNFLRDAKELAASSRESKAAWEIFCSPKDTEDLVPLIEGSTPAEIEEPLLTSVQESSRLGQYFASTENAELLISIFLDRIQPELEIDESPIVLLEPSCGHGDLVRTLVQELKKRRIPKCRVSILCFDIDKNAIKTCQDRYGEMDFGIKWSCQNFLETRSYSYDVPQKAKVFCFGGPPYTTGAGAGHEIKRDLPTLFINNCVENWKASVICFLLPARYGALKTDSSNHLDVETIELQSSTFLFQGTRPVIQPSIIQCYTTK